MIRHLLYLHGFRSSPRSAKATQTAAWMAAHRPDVAWWCPQLPAAPAEAAGLILDRVAGWPAASSAVIGSSLGGFYATVVAERLGWPAAVLLNPAVDPARDLALHLGPTTAWHSDAAFWFRAEYLDQLRAIAPPPALTRPERYLAIIAKGDEVLDWTEMARRYAAGQVLLLEGGDHALSDFEQHLPTVVRFLGLDGAACAGSAPPITSE